MQMPGWFAGFIRVEAILKAAVPLVKFYDRRSGIECDISVDNQDAVVKSHFLRLVGLLDSRYHKLCYLVCSFVVSVVFLSIMPFVSY